MVGIQGTIADNLPSEAVIFGSSSGMQELRVRIEAALRCHSPLLIQGESGIGKQLVARYVHHRSDRSDGPFVRIACCGKPPEDLEAELFGYEEGAFPDIRDGRRGLVEAAEGGTLFISQIEDMDLRVQGKVCQLLREGSYCRLGGIVGRRADVRVICSTKLELMTEVNRGRFRQDLFCCISTLYLRPAALRDRSEDIPVLWKFFAERMAQKFKKDPPQLTTPVLHVLEQWYWPGNLRELENRVARVVILSDLEGLAAELRCELACNLAVETQPGGLFLVRSDNSEAVKTRWSDLPLNRLGEEIIRSRPEAFQGSYRKPRKGTSVRLRWR